MKAFAVLLFYCPHIIHITHTLSLSLSFSLLQVKVTYFDTTGRPVVVLRKSNLVEEHMQEFSVTYTMPALSVLREPLMAVAFFLVLFVSAIVLNRISLSIAPDAAATKKKE